MRTSYTTLKLNFTTSNNGQPHVNDLSHLLINAVKKEETTQIAKTTTA